MEILVVMRRQPVRVRSACAAGQHPAGGKRRGDLQFDGGACLPDARSRPCPHSDGGESRE